MSVPLLAATFCPRVLLPEKYHMRWCLASIDETPPSFGVLSLGVWEICRLLTTSSGFTTMAAFFAGDDGGELARPPPPVVPVDLRVEQVPQVTHREHGAAADVRDRLCERGQLRMP